MSTYLSPELRIRLEEMDDHRCAYCQTSAWNTGQPLTVDHIIPKVQGGETNYANLCLACRGCNEYKGSQTTATDPLSGEIVSLFHCFIRVTRNGKNILPGTHQRYGWLD